MSESERTVPSSHLRIGRLYFDPRWTPTRLVSAPGRIELIGNHLDYNGGPVLAAAIDKRIDISARTNSAGFINAIFADFDENRLHSLLATDFVDWRSERGAPAPVDYLRGAIAALRAREIPLIPGLDLVVSGDLPYGVGLSSSAALCVALVLALSGDELDRNDLVLLAKDAENRTGSPCGTMDQSASVFGEVIRFDGATNAVQSMTADLGDHVFVVANSGIVRNLATSAYPTRVTESHEALAILNDAMPGRMIGSLAEIPPSQLGNVQAILNYHQSGGLFKRVRHVISETDRVKHAEICLKGHWKVFGELMTLGGRSSATDYEISHPQVEELVQLCLEVDGVLGARMMGGGQGGSVLVLLKQSGREPLADQLRIRYYEPHGISDIARMLFTCRFDSGAWVRNL